MTAGQFQTIVVVAPYPQARQWAIDRGLDPRILTVISGRVDVSRCRGLAGADNAIVFLADVGLDEVYMAAVRTRVRAGLVELPADWWPGTHRCPACWAPATKPEDTLDQFCVVCQAYTATPEGMAVARQQAFDAAALAHSRRVPAYSVTTGRDGEFIALFSPETTSPVSGALIGGDCKRRFLACIAESRDGFADIRVKPEWDTIDQSVLRYWTDQGTPQELRWRHGHAFRPLDGSWTPPKAGFVGRLGDLFGMMVCRDNEIAWLIMREN